MLASRTIGPISRIVFRAIAPVAAVQKAVARPIVPAAYYSTDKPKITPVYSPHLTIYRFPFSAFVSITHRVTGIMLSAGIWGIGCAAVLAPAAIPATIACVKGSAALLAVTKAAVSFPLAFHSFSGIRHIVWDHSHWGIESVEAVATSGKIIIGAATLVTLIALLI